MRRALAIVRRPAVWLGVLLFIAWIWRLKDDVPPRPQFVIETGAAEEWEEMARRPTGTWPTVLDIADDGSQVTIGIHEGDFRFVRTRLALWDTSTGTNQSPPHWFNEEWSRRLSGHSWRDHGMMELLTQPAGRELLRDEEAWTALRQRMKSYRARAIEDLSMTIRRDLRDAPPRDPSGKEPDPFPNSHRFSPDGQLIAYMARNGYPVYVVGESLGDGTAFEDVRTGKRVAFLPRVEHLTAIAPGGRTAVYRNFGASHEGEQPRLHLWDLETSSLRAELWLASDHAGVHYSPDGRYLFARYESSGGTYVRHLKWWDTTTGKEVSDVANVVDVALVDDGRIVVTHPTRLVKQGGLREAYRLQFWDSATGASLGDWDLGERSDGGGMINYLVAPRSSRFLAGRYEPDYGVGRSPGGRVTDGVARQFGGDRRRERHEIILWDLGERRELTRLPGQSVAFSPNGNWLATIDDRGTLRGWELPTKRPWDRILGVAAIATLCSGAVLFVVGRWLRRSCGRGIVRKLRNWTVWLCSSPARRWWTAGIAGSMVVLFGGLMWYSVAAGRAHREMETVYEQIGRDTTEADVTAMVGKPPVEGPLGPIPGWVSGGGETGIPVTVRKWRRYGTEMDVHFGEDGFAKASYISDPPVGWDEWVLNWIGW
jgi:hypothetical protein